MEDGLAFFCYNRASVSTSTATHVQEAAQTRVMYTITHKGDPIELR